MAAAQSPTVSSLASWRTILALSLGGIGFAAAVASLYASPIEGVTDLGCGRVFDCSDVLGSEWGSIAGIPLGVLGGLYFASWMSLLVILLRQPRPALQWALSWTLLLGAGFSLFLLGLLFFFIDGSCLYCLVTHACNLAAAGILWPLRLWKLSHPASTFRQGLAGLIMAGLVAMLVGVGLFLLYQDRIERAEATAQEETIW